MRRKIDWTTKDLLIRELKRIIARKTDEIRRLKEKLQRILHA